MKPRIPRRTTRPETNHTFINVEGQTNEHVFKTGPNFAGESAPKPEEIPMPPIAWIKTA